MAYTKVTPARLKFFGKVWFDPLPFQNGLKDLLKNSFQTQAGRDAVRDFLQNSLKEVIAKDERFPEDAYYGCIALAPLQGLWAATLQASDTKSRYAEDEKPERMSSAVELNATKRVDDATVAVRNCLQNLQTALFNGEGLYGLESFEEASGLVWVDAEGVVLKGLEKRPEVKLPVTTSSLVYAPPPIDSVIVNVPDTTVRVSTDLE